MSDSNVLDLTSYFSSTDPLNENTCYFKAYQNLAEMCLQKYKKDLDECANNPDQNARLGCEIKSQQEAFKCVMYKILSDSKNYTYNHCSGQNLPIGSKYTEEQKMGTAATTSTLNPTRIPPAKINYPQRQEPKKDPIIPPAEPLLKSMPQKKKLSEKIFTIFRKRQD